MTWVLLRPFQYKILDTNLVIDVGFVTDFASITIPAQLINQIQPLDTWPVFSARLIKQGVKEPSRAGGTPAYCAAGN